MCPNIKVPWGQLLHRGTDRAQAKEKRDCWILGHKALPRVHCTHLYPRLGSHWDLKGGRSIVMSPYVSRFIEPLPPQRTGALHSSPYILQAWYSRRRIRISALWTLMWIPSLVNTHLWGYFRGHFTTREREQVRRDWCRLLLKRIGTCTFSRKYDVISLTSKKLSCYSLCCVP